jgi:hypothetical protein
MTRARVLPLTLLAAASLACAAPAAAQQPTIRAGQTVSGSLGSGDPTGDDDSYYHEYTYVGSPGDRIVITLRSRDFDAFLFWGTGRGSGFVMQDADDDGGGGTDSRLEVTATSDSHTVRVNTLGAGETGAYTLTVERVGGSGGGTQARAIGPGQTVNGRLERTDPALDDASHYHDYRYTGSAGDRIIITLRSRDFDALLLWGHGTDGQFAREAGDDDSGGGTDSRLEVTVGSAAYTIRVNSIESRRAGNYTLAIETVGGTTRQAGDEAIRRIATGQSVDGRLVASDPQFSDGSHYHIYRHDARAGERLTISLESDDFDTYLRWGRVAGDGVEDLQDDDDGGDGTNSMLDVVAGADGTYLIVANSYNAGGLGSYRLSVRSAGSAGPTMPSLTAGSPVRGRLQPSDPVLGDNTHYQLFTYRGQPGEQVVFTLRSSDFDAYMSGGRMNGDRFEADLSDDDSGGGTDAQIVATVGPSGTYVVRANSLVPATGAFTLTAQPAATAAATSRGNAPGQRTVAADARITGVLRPTAPMLADSSHYEQYVYEGRAGDRIRITLRSSDFDAFLRWGRLDGDRFRAEAHDDDGAGGTDARLEVTVGGTGTYALQVNSYSAGQTGAYSLTVERLAAPVVATPDAGRSGAAAGKWLPAFRESGNPTFRNLGQRVRQQRTLEQISELLNDRFPLPRNVPVIVAECERINAFYSPRDQHVVFCYELVEHLARTFVRDNAWTAAQREAVDGAMRFILMHEVGHALVHILDLPITGREEDAVDQLAALMLIESGEKGAQAALNGVLAIQSGSREFEELELAGEHSLGPQRLYNVACWIYGSDPQKYRGIVTSGQLPESRAVRCPSEYDRLQKAWTRILQPYQQRTG